MIGTPTHDGRVTAHYVDALINSIQLASKESINILPLFICYDSILPKARNKIFKYAIKNKIDDLIFIDQDVEFTPQDILKILSHDELIVGGALTRKTGIEGYTFIAKDKKLKYNDSKTLIEVDGIGTGFLKISKIALDILWDNSAEYITYDDDNIDQIDDKERLVFNFEFIDGGYYGEDFVMCLKWQSLGYKVWLDPSITLGHIGMLKYRGHAQTFINNTYITS